MYSYDQALNKSIQYFNGDELAAKVFLDKYALKNGDELLESTPDDMHKRLAKEFARIEKNKYDSRSYINSEEEFDIKFKHPLSEDFIYSLFKEFKYIVCQGSPSFGIGNNYQIVSLSNCYVLETPQDSYNSILDTDKQLVNISKRRGGVGIDLSNLRPSGTKTNNAAKTSTGIVSWMERYSNSIREVGQNARRGALMLSLDVHHPDILEFSTIKNDNTKVTGANISVKLSKDFLTALKDKKDYELRFPTNSKNPKISKMISAQLVWDTIVKSAWLRAEPGILMWDNILKGPADCYENYRSKSTNPCAEIPLSEFDSCRLICLNLYSYIKNHFTKDAVFDFDKFKLHCKIAQRLMDDLVDLESEKIDAIIKKIDGDPEEEKIKSAEKEMWIKIKRFNNEGRRTGLGITALGDTLAALNIKYGNEESITKTEEIYKTLKLGAYSSSVEMAKILGPFKDWDYNKEKNCEFLNRIKEEDIDLFNNMKKYGRRNIALLTTAPTGTVSTLTQTSSGIEPAFMLSYTRRKKINPGDKNARIDFTDQNGDQWQEFTVYHHKLKEWMDITKETDITKSAWYGGCAEDIDWINRVKLQSAAQKHVCHAISSTINLPENISLEEVKKIYETAYDAGCKGITIYRKNCRTGVLVENNNSKNQIKYNDAPKRMKELPCKAHLVTRAGKEYFVLIGFLNDMPFEIFAGSNNHILSKKITNGKIIKKGRGKYRAELEDGIEISPLSAFISDEEEAVTRLISISLRHGIKPEFLCSQLSKTKGGLHNLEKVIAKVLGQYIENGTKATGLKCTECDTQLIYQESCIKCPNCGWSKC